ncbi:MAG: alanine racemase [Geothrix sp.]|uniref:alanine racemase n=1 Tax=Geothrix sp. TaxID=1962974 RepID=UPI001834268B|nr:alanine racemase [Geothrix sp.]NWJ39632.1 alanine racemase [Geothrix sp.]WIL22346.1 MAG: alanine racemase [Geothrix sp.]
MNEQHLEPLIRHPEGRALRAEVDLGRIGRNLERIRTAAGGREVWGVVKANAYGHGAVPVGRALAAAGAHGLAVSSLEEGLELRQGGIGCPVLVLGGLRPEALPAASSEGLTIAVVGPEHLAEYARILPSHPVRLHLKLDTGMGRFGLLPSELGDCLAALRQLAPWIDGAMGHFATADDADLGFALRQRRVFEGCLAQLVDAGIHPVQRHHGNSDACLRNLLDQDTHLRPGLALFGLTTLPEGRQLGLEPALALVAEVARVKTVPAGTTVGYGRTFVAPQPMQIATLACGYADGYRRDLGNRGVVGFAGQTFPVVGRVSMDYLTVALPLGTQVAPGDPMTLFSADPAAPHSLERLSQVLGTIPYELTCALHRRISRRYFP